MHHRRHRPLLSIVTAASILGLPAGTAAQSTRAEAIALEQERKAQHLAAETSPVGEVVVTRVMRSPLLSGSGGAYPWFGSIHSGTGFGIGVGFLHRAAYGSRANGTIAFSTNGSRGIDASWYLPAPRVARRFRPWVDLEWSALEGLTTYGIGPTTTAEDRTTFDYRPRSFNAGATMDLRGPLSISGSLGYLGFSTAGEGAGAGPLPALGDELGYTVGRLEAIADWRASPGYNTQGGFVRGEWQQYGARDDRPFSFGQFEVEGAFVTSFVRDQFGLVMRVVATTTTSSDTDDVPFVLLPFVGSGDTVRALANRRLHDRGRLVLNGEYRWRPSRYLDMALFVDSGSVAPRLADLADSRFRTGYGVGARLHGPAFTAFRVDVAHGPEGFNVVFAGGLPF